MSAFKQFLTSDIIVTPYTVNKTFYFEGFAQLTSSTVGIDTYIGRYQSGLVPTWETTGAPTLTQEYTVYKPAIYHSVKQLYYSNYSSSRYNASGSYENYLPSTLNWSIDNANNITPNKGINRYFPFTESYNDSVVGVITIPRKIFGNYIKPGTFNYDYTLTVNLKAISGSLFDDGQGNVYTRPGTDYVGNIIYEHGLVVLTKNEQVGSYRPGEYAQAIYGDLDVYGNTGIPGVYLLPSLFSNLSRVTCSFDSSLTMFQTQFKCTVSPNEFTTTLNPTVFDGTGSVKPFATSSYFAPYITTVGLYNDNQELLAVAKLSQPIQSSTTTDTTILVNIDR